MRTHAHPGGMWCSECGHKRGPREGQPIPPNWDFEARRIADGLLAVGDGATYRDAAERMRMAAYRFQRDPSGIAYTSRAGETVARYIDHFAPLILAEVDHPAWPEVLVLDALPLRRREVKEDDPFSWELEGNGAILFALGYTEPLPRRDRRGWRGQDAVDLLTAFASAGVLDQLPRAALGLLAQAAKRPRRKPKRIPHLWKIAVAGGLDRWSWLEFLRSLPGTPKWVVVDGDAAVRYAVRLRWGNEPVIYSCEGHLKRKFQQRALKDKLSGAEVADLWPDYNRQLPEMTRGPLWTPDDYRALLDKLLALPPAKTRIAASWVAHHDALIRRQFDLRVPGNPRGIGAVEGAITKVDGWIGERRRSFQNVRRLNLTLSLMRASIAGHADPVLYARIIREELERCGGRPRLNWRQFHDPVGVKGLFRLSDAARARAESERQAYWVAAQGDTLARKVASANAYHAANGFPLLEMTDARTPSVKVEGKTVADFPLIAREWDEANDGDPASTPAGADAMVGWICDANPEHRWNARVVQRCGRLTGCRECGRVRGVAATRKGQTTNLAKIRAAWGDYDKTEPPTLTDAEIDALLVMSENEAEEMIGQLVAL